MGSSSHKRKSVRHHTKRSPKWFSRRSVIAIFAAACVGATGIIAFDYGGLIISHHDSSVPGWIIDGSQLQSLMAYSPSTLPKTYFDTRNTFVLKETAAGPAYIPAGWRSRAGVHYTSYSTHDCSDVCYPFMKDLASGSLRSKPKPTVMYDDEHWGRTPGAEQFNPCGYMEKFVTTAHQNGLTTILAPDQDLAEPGISTHYQGGESENWQTYLRLGLASCAAKTGTEWYHIMSQPFEAHWCGNLLGKCQSSESDFVNFVTQAALQARAVNPKLKISDGLSTNPNYFGYFRGAETLARVMYRDYADVRQTVDAVWMNIVGRNGNTTTLYFLSMLGKKPQTDRRSSVLFLQGDSSLHNTQQGANHAGMFSLSSNGASKTFISNQTLSGGTTLPAGTGEFQFWTDGSNTDSAQIGVTFGYCTGESCTDRQPIRHMDLWAHGSAKGTVTPGGAFTTTADAALPQNGSYRLYVQVTVENGAPFNLLYGSTNAPTNLATPVLLPL